MVPGSLYFALQSHSVSGVMELHKALAEIRAIRDQLARNSESRGYGPAALAITGVLFTRRGGASTLAQESGASGCLLSCDLDCDHRNLVSHHRYRGAHVSEPHSFDLKSCLVLPGSNA